WKRDPYARRIGRDRLVRFSCWVNEFPLRGLRALATDLPVVVTTAQIRVSVGPPAPNLAVPTDLPIKQLTRLLLVAADQSRSADAVQTPNCPLICSAQPHCRGGAVTPTLDAVDPHFRHLLFLS